VPLQAWLAGAAAAASGGTCSAIAAAVGVVRIAGFTGGSPSRTMRIEVEECRAEEGENS